MKKTFIFICFCFALVSHVFALEVSAKSAILYEPETGKVLFSKDSETVREIASTTKIMTAVVALENAELSDVVSVPKLCIGTEGSSMYLKPDEKLSVSDLLYGLMLQSGNDAAVALAHFVGNGNVDNFVDMMNATAKRIGMKNTCFKNPHGLPAEGHVSTAYDMSLLAAYCMKNPDFVKIVSTKSINIAGRYMANHNKLLRLCDGVNGIKTGFTKAAGRCLVSSAERDGMNLIAVTLSAPDDWNDHIRMFDYGFDNFSIIRTPSRNSTIAQIEVVGGIKSTVSAVLKEEKTFLQKNEDDSRVCEEIFLPRFIYAPVTQGDVIGELRYTINGELVAKCDIVSDTTVEYYKKPTLMDKIVNFFRRK